VQQIKSAQLAFGRTLIYLLTYLLTYVTLRLQVRHYHTVTSARCLV